MGQFITGNKKNMIEATKELGITIDDLKTRIDAVLDPLVVGEGAPIYADPTSTIIHRWLSKALSM